MAAQFAQPVTPSQLGYTQGQHGFAALAASSLSGLGDSSDSFDSALLAIVNALPQHDQLAAASDEAFGEFAGAAGAFPGTDLADLAAFATALHDSMAAYNQGVAGSLIGSLPAFNAPATPGTIVIPDFNVSTGIIVTPQLPVPQPPSPKPGPPSPGPPPVIIISTPPPVIIGSCDEFGPGSIIPTCGPGVPAGICYDDFGLPVSCLGEGFMTPPPGSTFFAPEQGH